MQVVQKPSPEHKIEYIYTAIEFSFHVQGQQNQENHTVNKNLCTMPPP
jgi:hypothetical protein